MISDLYDELEQIFGAMDEWEDDFPYVQEDVREMIPDFNESEYSHNYE